MGTSFCYDTLSSSSSTVLQTSLHNRTSSNTCKDHERTRYIFFHSNITHFEKHIHSFLLTPAFLSQSHYYTIHSTQSLLHTTLSSSLFHHLSLLPLHQNIFKNTSTSSSSTLHLSPMSHHQTIHSTLSFLYTNPYSSLLPPFSPSKASKHI